MVEIIDLKITAKGSERSFLLYCGLTEQNLNGKHQPCPGCGGKDRYRSMPDGGFVCGGGGDLQGGDWIDHVAHACNMSTFDVLSSAEEFYGLKDQTPEEKKASYKRRQKILAESKIKAELKQKNSQLDFDIRWYADEICGKAYTDGPEREIEEDERSSARKLLNALIKRYRK